jgi:branched-chain amino acid aminotransferase
MADVEPIAFFRKDFIPFEEASLSIACAPVLYGLSIYTVFPVFGDHKSQKLNMFRLKDHFTRLQNSAKIMAFDGFLNNWNYEKFLAIMRELLQRNHVKQDSLVLISVFGDDSLKGVRMYGLAHSLSVFVYSTPPLLPKSGARLMVSSWRRTPDNSIPSRAKINGSYANAALMKHEAEMSGFDDAIALDEQGHVTEAKVANIFLFRNGKLMTADNSTDLLEGITRDTILRMSENLGVEHEKRPIGQSELYLADEILLCGSSVQITTVIEIDHRPIASEKPGKITKQLMETYANLRQAKEPYLSWLTPVGMVK